jgi:hypothetical protein
MNTTADQLPIDVWFRILTYCEPRDVLSSIVSCQHMYRNIAELIEETHDHFSNQQALWKYMIMSQFIDDSTKKREEAKTETSTSIYMFETTDEEFKFNKIHDQAEICDEKPIYWRKKYLEIIANRKNWVDKVKTQYTNQKKVKPRGTSYTKSKCADQKVRLIMCGKKEANKHQVLQNLSKFFKTETTYTPLPGIKDAITITRKKKPEIVIYMVDDPFDYVNSYDGCSYINGVIYVVDADSFPKNYTTIYRHFHDCCGEWKYLNLACLIVVNNGESYELSDAVSFDVDDIHTTTSQYASNVIGCTSVVLRLSELNTCSWYWNANSFIADTSKDKLVSEFTNLMSYIDTTKENKPVEVTFFNKLS